MHERQFKVGMRGSWFDGRKLDAMTHGAPRLAQRASVQLQPLCRTGRGSPGGCHQTVCCRAAQHSTKCLASRASCPQTHRCSGTRSRCGGCRWHGRSTPPADMGGRSTLSQCGDGISNKACMQGSHQQPAQTHSQMHAIEASEGDRCTPGAGQGWSSARLGWAPCRGL